ncbi:thioredoxin-like protein [Gymnopilus junonius]|uniref:thioredoxin-dependent peroxiredoxin n=1 Tax=Gymnopilus junonius TaxID=109634 RepID=A0A9P5TT28_GYMJU|nr:thioredoxin-like protein [Gymnopilus junonius]
MSFQSLIGKAAPAITLKNYDGESFTFAPGESGLPAALFFYPESGTYGCTREACQFRDAVATKDTFKPGKVQIIGISPDPVEKQKAFVEKHKLTYPVLSDGDKSTFKTYGIGKGMFGFTPVARVTFVVDKKGTVRDALDATINYAAHSKFVEKWLDKLQAEDAKEGVKEAAPAPPSNAPAPAPAQAATAGAPVITEVPTSTSEPTETVTATTEAPAPEQAEASSTIGQPAPPEPATAPTSSFLK